MARLMQEYRQNRTDPSFRAREARILRQCRRERYAEMLADGSLPQTRLQAAINTAYASRRI